MTISVKTVEKQIGDSMFKNGARHICSMLLLLLTAFLISGCGVKGALYLPKEEQKEER